MPRNPPRFEVGQSVTFSRTVKKIREEGRTTWGEAELPHKDTYFMDEQKAWDFRRETFSVGTIVGQRFLTDYALEAVYDDIGFFGVPTTSTDVRPVSGTTRRAWLIAFDLHRKPVYALDAYVEPLPSREQKMIQWLAHKLTTTNNALAPSTMDIADWIATAEAVADA